MNSKIENSFKGKLNTLNKRRETQEKKSELLKETHRSKSEKQYQTKLKRLEKRRDDQYKNIVRKEKGKPLKNTIPKRKTVNLRNECCKIRQKLARISRADENGMCQCISCKMYYNRKNIDGGHYIDKRFRTEYDFHILNIRPQCRDCNGIWHTQKQGNKGLYRKHLVQKIGEENVILLDNYEKKRRSREEYEKLIIEGKSRIEEEEDRGRKERWF